MTSDNIHPSIQEKGRFLAEYSAQMWECGATCIRIEKNVGRISMALHVNCELTIMPNYVMVNIREIHDDSDPIIYTRKIRHCAADFDMNTRLSRLSWELADRHITFDRALHDFRHITSVRPAKTYVVLLLVSLANAAFCRLFGGDFVAMAVVFLSTAAGYDLKLLMTKAGRDLRLTFICASFLSATLSAGAHIFNIGSTPLIALATSVLYLIPGVPYINAASDLIDRHYICASSRLADAVALTACIGIGLCGGMYVLGLK